MPGTGTGGDPGPCPGPNPRPSVWKPPARTANTGTVTSTVDASTSPRVNRRAWGSAKSTTMVHLVSSSTHCMSDPDSHSCTPGSHCSSTSDSVRYDDVDVMRNRDASTTPRGSVTRYTSRYWYKLKATSVSMSTHVTPSSTLYWKSLPVRDV